MRENEMVQLFSPRLMIEPFGRRHVGEHYLAWLNDPVTMAYSEQRHRRHSLESVAAYRESFKNTPNQFWAVLTRADDTHIGNVSVARDVPNSLANVSILIGDPAVRGLGLGWETWMTICDYLLRRLEIRKVQAGTLEVNAPMLALARKAGMAEDGRRMRHYVWQGREVDLVHFALFRDAWLARFPRGCWPASQALQNESVIKPSATKGEEPFGTPQ